MTSDKTRAELRSELWELGRAWAKQRARERLAAERLANAVRRAAAADIPETELSELSTADRGTVRTWVGKPRVRRNP